MEWWFSWQGDPAEDLAREEVLLERAGATGRPHGLVCRWPRPVLVLGYGQDPRSVDLAGCRAMGLPVVRRATGGTGVLYDGDLALSLALPPGHPWGATIEGLYGEFVDSIRSGLQSRGVETLKGEGRARTGRRSPICFEDQSAETLLLGGRKILGCAQARRREGVLVHGALLLGVDPLLQARAYNVAPERIEALLGCVPRDAYRSPEDLGAHLAEAISGGLHAGGPQFSAPPALSNALRARLRDSKWAPG